MKMKRYYLLIVAAIVLSGSGSGYSDDCYQYQRAPGGAYINDSCKPSQACFPVNPLPPVGQNCAVANLPQITNVSSANWPRVAAAPHGLDYVMTVNHLCYRYAICITQTDPLIGSFCGPDLANVQDGYQQEVVLNTDSSCGAAD